MIKALFLALAASFFLAACGDDASKKGTTPAPSTPSSPPVEKKVEPKK